MAELALPACISHTVLVHAGSYKDFLKQLTTKFPDLHIKFVKRVAIHYYILQLEDHSEKGIKKQEIYDLPVMALREEFSSYTFFKNTRSYNNVLKRMCNANDNKDAAYDFLQHMMTPFEKSRILHLQDAKKLEIVEKDEANQECHVTYLSHEEIVSMKVLSKIFNLSKVVVDDEEKEFNELVKDQNWIIGIH